MLANRRKMFTIILIKSKFFSSLRPLLCQSQWPRGLRRGSAAARLLRSWVRIPPWAWMFVCCECCVLSGRGLCDELITRPEESYRLWCVVVCDLETSRMRRPWPALGRSDTEKKNGHYFIHFNWDFCCLHTLCKKMRIFIKKFIYKNILENSLEAATCRSSVPSNKFRVFCWCIEFN